MPHLQTILGQLNTAFSKGENIAKLAARREAFAPGNALAAGVVVDASMALHTHWQTYLGTIPKTIQEAIRSVIYQALSTSPPTPVTFAWAPGYDFELTIWHAPDTRLTRGGVTVLIKSRYPDDKHPLHNEPPHGS